MVRHPLSSKNVLNIWLLGVNQDRSPPDFQNLFKNFAFSGVKEDSPFTIGVRSSKLILQINTVLYQVKTAPNSSDKFSLSHRCWIFLECLVTTTRPVTWRDQARVAVVRAFNTNGCVRELVKRILVKLK